MKLEKDNALEINDLIKALQSLRNKCRQMELTLRNANKNEEADQARQKKEELQEIIDILSGQLLEVWTAELANATKDIRKINAKISECISRIRQEINIAKDVTDIFELIYSFALPRYSPVRVSTLTVSPFSTNGGTLIRAPPSQRASFS